MQRSREPGVVGAPQKQESRGKGFSPGASGRCRPCATLALAQGDGFQIPASGTGRESVCVVRSS